MTRKILRKKDKGKENAHHSADAHESAAGEIFDDAGLGGSSQRVREHGLRVMRATREQLDEAMLERARQAVIESALAGEDSADQYADGEKEAIDKRKNLKTIQTLLQRHDTSQEMQHNISAMLQDITRH